MPDHWLSDIFRKNDELGEQLSLWRYMRNRERTAFIEEVKAFIDEIRMFDLSRESRSTESTLHSIMKTWEIVLARIKTTPANSLTVLSNSKKIFPVPRVIIGEKPSMLPITEEWQRIYRSVHQPLSPHKVDHNLPPPVPRDPKIRAIYDKYHGIIDSKGDAE